MADDRVFLVCDHCGGWVVLMRVGGGEYYPPGNAADVEAWLGQHARCHVEPGYAYDLHGDCGFHLRCESARPGEPIVPLGPRGGRG